MNIKSLSLFVLITFGSILNANAESWVFFDLGNTLIDSRDKKNIQYIEGAYEYLIELKARGIKIGMISNIPQSFGKTDELKLISLKKFVRNGWVGNRDFDWGMFDHFLFPPSDELRKPHPFLFLKALKISGSCMAMFQGESQIEIDAAKSVGIFTHLVRPFYIQQDPDNTYTSISKYHDLQKLDDLFSKHEDGDCQQIELSN